MSPGTVRALTIKDGPTFTVKPGKEGMTTVTWSATFTRKNPSDNPPEGEIDEAAAGDPR